MFTKVEEPAEFEDPYYGEEEDDTLSLCDLPIYGDEAADEYLEKYDTPFSSFSSSSSSYDEEFFELSPPLEATKPETIVFCGKLIPYKKKHPSSKCPRKGQTIDGVSLPLEKYVGSGRKVSRGKSSSGPGWNLLLFGLAKFPGHVEMRDIKKRQIKGRGSSSRGLNGSRKYSDQGSGEIVTRGDQVKGKGLWAVLRAIGCMGHSANSMIKASLHCVPKI